MLSSELVARFAKYTPIGKDKKLISPNDVYAAATNAQMEILRALCILEDKTTLIFPASTEQCIRQSRTVSTITGTTTVEVTTTEVHGYQTGEEYVVQGVLGITGVNGRRTITVTSTTKFTLNNTTGASAYTSGGTIYPIIQSAVEILGGKQTSPNSFPLELVSYETINQDREGFADSVESGSAYRIYQIGSDPIIIGLQGTSTEAITTEVSFTRIPLPNENVSATVNPIIPDKYKRVMELGTLTHIFEDMNEVEAFELSDIHRKRFEQEMMRVRSSSIRSKMRSSSSPTGLRW